MQRKDIIVGEIYAFGFGRQSTDWRHAYPVKIVSVEPKFHEKQSRYREIERSGIRAVRLSPTTLEPTPANDREAALTFGGPGKIGEEFWVESREIWHSWGREVEIQAAKAAKGNAEERRLAEAEAADDAAKATVLPLLPAGYEIRWDRRNPHSKVSSVSLTPRALADLLKAARTAALDEAFGDDAK